MSPGPDLDPGSASRSTPPRRRNFTALQFALFAAAAVLGLAALSAAGLALGFALAGAAMIAAVALVAWIVVANLFGRKGGLR